MQQGYGNPPPKGGPYGKIASAQGTSFVDRSVTGGQNFYYVISAVNAAGESPNSPEDLVKPASP